MSPSPEGVPRPTWELSGQGQHRGCPILEPRAQWQSHISLLAGTELSHEGSWFQSQRTQLLSEVLLSQVLRSLPHILEGSQVVDGPSSSAQISPTDALSLEKNPFLPDPFPRAGTRGCPPCQQCPLPRRLAGEGWAQGGQDPLTFMATTVPSRKSWEPAKPQTPRKGWHGRNEHKFTSLGLFPAACLKAKSRLCRG